MKQIYNLFNYNKFNLYNYIINRNLRRKLPPNPGISNQLKLLNDKEIHKIVPDDFDNNESDFMNVNEEHRLYENEMKYRNEKMEYWIVKNKYFKEKQKNFLTWSEKEQIRFLHQHDPNEWTVEKLSNSFPADHKTIARLIKAKWYPKDEKRIEKHDLMVRENWELFKNNKIKNLDMELKNHLIKFVERSFDTTQLSKNINKQVVTIEKPLTECEFSSIITKSEKYLNKSENSKQFLIESKEFEKDLIKKPSRKDMFILGEMTDREEIQFKDLQKNCVQQPETKTSNGNEIKINQNKEFNLFKSKPEVVDLTQINPSDSKVDHIKEHIRIPKKYWKENATYRMGDCFYSDDGEFLYRVPGLF